MPFFLILTFFALIPSHILAAEESITLTTYYPSPYGVYGEMRLYPKSSPNSPCQEGTMYYDSDAGEKGLKVCDASGNPQSIGGGYWAAGSVLNSIYNTNSGNVGIGTASPATALDVKGTLTIRAPDDGVGGTLSSVSTSGALVYAPASSGGYSVVHIFKNRSGGDIMDLDGTGAVGIGTPAPVTRLSVRVDGNGANAVLRLSSILSSWTAGYGPRLLFHGGTDDRVFGEIGSFLQNTGTGANAYMTFSTRDSEVLGERMRITSNGNVGIGTPGPATRLHIAGPATGAIKIEDGNQAAGRVLTSDANGVGTWQPSGGGGMSNIRVFTASGTFTVPAGITKLWVEVYGGGGAGGGSEGGVMTDPKQYKPGGGGGGAGGVAMGFVSVSPGQNIAVTVGAGGLSGGCFSGGWGGTSSFSTLRATGGGGGYSGSGNWNLGGDGGVGSGGAIILTGSAGEKGLTMCYSYGTGTCSGYTSIGGAGGSNNRGISGGGSQGQPGGVFGGGGTGNFYYCCMPCNYGGTGGSGGVIIWY